MEQLYYTKTLFSNKKHFAFIAAPYPSSMNQYSKSKNRYLSDHRNFLLD